MAMPRAFSEHRRVLAGFNLLSFLILALLQGGSAQGQQPGTRRILCEISVEEPSPGFVRTVQLRLRRQGQAAQFQYVELRRDGDRFLGEYTLPADLLDVLIGQLGLVTSNPGGANYALETKPMDFRNRDAGDFRISRRIQFVPVRIEAVRGERDASGAWVERPVAPQAVVRRRVGDTYVNVAPASQTRFVNGVCTTFIPRDPFELPAGTNLEVYGQLGSEGPLQVTATTPIQVPYQGEVQARLVFGDVLGPLRVYLRDVLTAAGIDQARAQSITGIRVRQGRAGDNPRWEMDIVGMRVGFPGETMYLLTIPPNFNLSSPDGGPILMHEFGHHTQYVMGWQPPDAPGQGRDIQVPASIESQAWEEGVCHFLGSELLTRALPRTAGVAYPQAALWLDDAQDRNRALALQWRGQPSPNAPPPRPAMAAPGNWIEGIVTNALLELYREIRQDPYARTSAVLQYYLQDMQGFTQEYEGNERTAQNFFVYMRQNAGADATGVNPGRVVDQIALWYMIATPQGIPGLNTLVPTQLAAPQAGAGPGGPYAFQVRFRAFPRLVETRLGGQQRVRVRLMEGDRVLNPDLAMARDNAAAGYNFSGTAQVGFDAPGPHAVHAEVWSRFPADADVLLGRSQDVTVQVSRRTAQVRLDREEVRPGQALMAEAVLAGGGKPEGSVWRWEASPGLVLDRTEGPTVNVTAGAAGTVTARLVQPSQPAASQILAEASASVKVRKAKTTTVQGQAVGSHTFVQARYGHGANAMKCEFMRGYWNPGDTQGMRLLHKTGEGSGYDESWIVSVPATIEIDGDVKILSAGIYNWGGPTYVVLLDPQYDQWVQAVRVVSCPRTIGPATWDRACFGEVKRLTFKDVSGQQDPAAAAPLAWQGRSDKYTIYYRFLLETFGVREGGAIGARVKSDSSVEGFEFRLTTMKPPGAPWTFTPSVVVTASNEAPEEEGPVSLSAVVTGCDFSEDPITFAWSGATSSSGSSATLQVKDSGSYTVTCTATGKSGRALGTGRAVIEADLKKEVVVEWVSQQKPVVVLDETLRFRARLTSRGKPVPGAFTYQWQPHPEAEFQPFRSEDPATAVRFKRPGKTQLWVEVLQKKGDVFRTVATSAPLELEVTGPKASISFEPPDPFVGQDTRARASFLPEIGPTGTRLQWELSPNARPKSPLADVREVLFQPADTQPVTVSVHASTELHGDALAEARSTISAKARRVEVSLTGPASAPPPELGSFVPKNAIVPGQDFLIRGDLLPSPPVTVRYLWAVEGGSLPYGSVGQEIRVRMGDGGVCNASVTAQDEKGMVLGRGGRTVNATVSKAEIDAVRRKAEEEKRAREAAEAVQAKKAQAQRLVDEGLALEQRGDFTGAINKYDAARKTLPSQQIDQRIQALQAQLARQQEDQQRRQRAQQLVGEGYACEGKGNLDCAIAKYEEANRLSPNPQVSQKIAELQGRLSQAKQKQQNQVLAGRLWAEGMALEHEGKLRPALEKLEEAYRVVPNENARRQIENLKEKIRQKQARKETQAQADALWAEGVALDRQGNLRAALDKFEEAYDLVPNENARQQIQNLKARIARSEAQEERPAPTPTPTSTPTPPPPPPPQAKRGTYEKVDLSPIGTIPGRGGEITFNERVPIGGRPDGGSFSLPWFSSNSRHNQNAHLSVPRFHANTLYVMANCAWWGGAMANQAILGIRINGGVQKVLVADVNVGEWGSGLGSTAANTRKVQTDDQYTTSSYVTRFTIPETDVTSLDIELLVDTQANESKMDGQQVIELWGITLGYE